MRMDLFQASAALLTLAALFGYLNHRFVKLPNTIGVMLIALMSSVGVLWLGQIDDRPAEAAYALLGSIDFNKTLMQGMLGFLLFAAALHVNVAELRKHRAVIAILASGGVILSTLLVAGLTSLMLGLFGIEIPFIYCLLFGALISPTDPIAVLGILKHAGAPKALEMKITGESLFNDGVAVVLFLGLLEIATGGVAFDAGRLSMLFLQEAVGGAAFGFAIGWVALRMLRSIEDYKLEVLITLACAAGGYAAAYALHLSGPIAMVVAGLFIGTEARAGAVSSASRVYLDHFWELIDETLNAVLFVLIGLELLLITFTPTYAVVSVIAFAVMIFARFVAIALPITLMRKRQTFTKGAIKILTWGGLRGGVSVALALSIPMVTASGDVVAAREIIISITYGVVVLSIVGQGLTIAPLLSRSIAKVSEEEAAAAQAELEVSHESPPPAAAAG